MNVQDLAPGQPFRLSATGKATYTASKLYNHFNGPGSVSGPLVNHFIATATKVNTGRWGTGGNPTKWLPWNTDLFPA